MSDRYALAHEFEAEQIRRSIDRCSDIESLKAITHKLLQMCNSQKHMIGRLLLH